MKKFRKITDIITIIGAMIFIAPMFLVLNESTKVGMNILGFLYTIAFFFITKYSKGGRMFVKDVYRSTLRLFNFQKYEKKKN